jgi:tetratricopeptide (TPR) repeat protein
LLLPCLKDDVIPFIPDDLAKGTVHYFLGQCYQHLNLYKESLDQFQQCSSTHYVDDRRNSVLVAFAEAKLLQCMGKHEEALQKFSFCLTIQTDSAHCLFRRAWSYKVYFYSNENCNRT